MAVRFLCVGGADMAPDLWFASACVLQAKAKAEAEAEAKADAEVSRGTF